MPLAAGTQLGRYTVVKPLVSGGMTEVLLARASGSAGFSHHVVIKCIRANRSTDPQFIKMFLDEARLAASLHHHNIVQVHDVGRTENDYFFAMEYVHGETLRKLLTFVARANETVPLEKIITMGIAVASGLHYAHEMVDPDTGQPLGLVHRDVTPANILIGYDGNVKVVDFGIAKAMLRSTEATKSGTMKGKVAYMAPEQCLGRPIDRRSDIFALGIVLYELCTSRRLFKGDTDFLVMTSIVNGKIPKPTEFRKDLPLDLEDVILKALAPSPNLRFDTAEDLALALEKVAVNNQLRISASALSDYLIKIFGRRQEPWLDDNKFESVDVDFDGEGGSGLVEIPDEESSNPTINSELLESPILAATSSGQIAATAPRHAGDGDEDDFADEPKTEIQDPDTEDPPTLTGGNARAAADEARRLLAKPPTSGFESNERTLIGEQDDVDVLVKMSRIEGRKDSTPAPTREPTAPPRIATPPQAHPRLDMIPSRVATPPAQQRMDVTPTPKAQTGPQQPIDGPQRTLAGVGFAGTGPQQPISGTGSQQAMPRSPWGNPDPQTGHISVTGTPMAWVPQDGEPVPSLAPKGRRAMLIAAVAIPIVAIGVFFITRKEDPTPARTIEPDAFEAPIEMDAAAAAITPDAPIDAAVATKSIDAGVAAGSGSAAAGSAAKPATGSAGKPIVVGKPPIKKTVVIPPRKSPITKKPPLKR